jgi:hypothetical protein
MLLKINGTPYELSIKNCLFDKLNMENSANSDIQKSLLELSRNRNNFPLSASYKRHYTNLPTYASVFCKQISHEPDKKDILKDAQPSLVSPSGLKSDTKKPPLSGTDIFVVITLFLYRYHSVAGILLEEELLKSIPYLYANLVSISPKTYTATKNFIIFSRMGLGLSYAKTFIDLFRALPIDITKMVPEQSYELLWHATEDKYLALITPDFPAKFKLLLEKIRDLNNKLLGQIKPESTYEDIYDILNKIDSEVNFDPEIVLLFKDIFKMDALYEYLQDTPESREHAKQITMNISDADKEEIDTLVNTGKYSDVLITRLKSFRFNILHMHCLKDYYNFREYDYHYLSIPNKKISYMSVRDYNLVM